MKRGSDGCPASPASLGGCWRRSVTVAPEMAPRRRSMVCPPEPNLCMHGRSLTILSTATGTSAATAHEPNRVPPTRSRVACDAEATIPALSPLPLPAPPGKIVARARSSPFVRLSSYSERGRARSWSVSTSDGLTPAPRRVAAKAGAMVETPQSARSRVRLFGGPSLLTFGSQNSTGSRGFASSNDGSYGVVDGGRLSATDLVEGLSRECTRPDTPGSSRTFGKVGAGKRQKT